MEELLKIARPFFFGPSVSRINPLWRGQLFLFDRPQATSYSSQQGTRILAVFVLLEFAVRPLLRAGGKRWSITGRPWWLLLEMTLLAMCACWLVVWLTRVRLSQLGLYSWSRWSQIRVASAAGRLHSGGQSRGVPNHRTSSENLCLQGTLS